LYPGVGQPAPEPAEGYGPQATDPTVTATIRQVLQSNVDTREVISTLIGLLDGENPQLAAAAADELLKRDLDEAELRRLREVAERVPFRDWESDDRLPGETSNASGTHAWRVLEAKALPRMPQEEQIEWLVSWFWHGRPFRMSAADYATRPLSKMGPTAVPRLSAVLKTGDPYPQLWAGRALMDIGTDEAFAAVEQWGLSVIEEAQDPLVRGTATRWLGLLQSEAAFEPMLRVMWANLDEPSSSELVVGVQDTGWERAIPELVKVLELRPPETGNADRAQTYLAAAQALAELGDDRGRQALRNAASSPDAALRREAPWHLGCLGEREARPLLERLAQEADETTALRARECLRVLDQDAPYADPSQAMGGTMRLQVKRHERHTRWARDHAQ